MPPPDTVIDDAIDTLGQITLKSFTVEPAAITPTGQAVLRWDVANLPQGVRLSLGGRTPGESLPARGSRVVTPVETTTYRLVASASVVDAVLGQVTLNVDHSECVTVPIPEAEVRDRIRLGLDSVDGRKEEIRGVEVTIRQRRPAEVEVEEAGIRVDAAFEAKVPNFPNPKIGVEARIVLSVTDGQPTYTYAKFESEVDLPWWVWLPGVLVAGVAGLAVAPFLEALINDRLRPRLKDEMDAQITQVLNQFMGALPPGQALVSLTTVADQVLAETCPIDRPFAPPLRPIRTDPPVGMTLAPVPAASRAAGGIERACTY
jgi:hypothetical protein